MSEGLVLILFGFPAVGLSLLVSVLGILMEKPWLVIVGAILFAPFSYYLNGAPGSLGLPIFLPLFQVGSAAAIREKKKRWAWLLLLPAFVVSLYVAGVVLFLS
jgi:hypothetical protein